MKITALLCLGKAAVLARLGADRMAYHAWIQACIAEGVSQREMADRTGLRRPGRRGANWPPFPRGPAAID